MMKKEKHHLRDAFFLGDLNRGMPNFLEVSRAPLRSLCWFSAC